MKPGQVTGASWAAAIAAVICAIEAVALVAVSAYYLYELGAGASDDATRVVMSVVLFLVCAVLVAAMARAWSRGTSWPRTPTLVVNLLLLPSAWTLISRHTVGGIVVGLLAVTGVIAASAAKSGDD